jgi:hypothetical protein
LPVPALDEVPNGRGVLVRVLRCGVDGTDKEINAAQYGAAPDSFSYLVIIENLAIEVIAQAGVHEFLFCVTHHKTRGSTGAVIAPAAVV